LPCPSDGLTVLEALEAADLFRWNLNVAGEQLDRAEEKSEMVDRSPYTDYYME